MSLIKLTNEKVFILYKDLLAVIKPEMSIKEIARSTNKGNGKGFSKRWVQDICAELENLKLIRRAVDERHCVRYKRTAKGERLLKAESLDKI